MAQPRGTTNKNAAGDSVTRRNRKKWLLNQFGNGELVACYRQISPKCPLVLDFSTLSVDRVVPGLELGKYARGNILPACISCNAVAGNYLRWGKRCPGPSYETLREWALEPLRRARASTQTPQPEPERRVRPRPTRLVATS